MRVKNLNEVKQCLMKQKQFLKKYHIEQIGIFGSFTRNEQHEQSDIDILVDFGDYENQVDLFLLHDIKEFLTEKLGREVDLVMKNSLKPAMAGHILSEIIYL